jgi:hypothetical protein
MSDPEWRWLTGSIYGECHTCGEPLWQHHEMLVRWRDRNYHVHCLLDKLTNGVVAAAPAVEEQYGWRLY